MCQFTLCTSKKEMCFRDQPIKVFWDQYWLLAIKETDKSYIYTNTNLYLQQKLR